MAAGRGLEIMLPTRFLLPPGPREGIVINLAELRLYYYPKGENRVITYPLGIGREGWETPSERHVLPESGQIPPGHRQNLSELSTWKMAIFCLRWFHPVPTIRSARTPSTLLYPATCCMERTSLSVWACASVMVVSGFIPRI